MTKIRSIGGDDIRLPAPAVIEAGIVNSGSPVRSVSGAFLGRESRIEKRKLTVSWKGTDGETMKNALAAAGDTVYFTCADPFTGEEETRLYAVCEKRASVTRAADGSVMRGDWKLVLEET